MEEVDSGPDLAKLLSSVQTIAVVGLSPRPERDSHSVSRALQEAGYHIIGIHPDHAVLLGEPAYPSLAEIPREKLKTVDLVLVFRRPDAVPDLLREAVRLGLETIWLQVGASDAMTLEVASELPGRLVHEKCIRVVVSQLSYFGAREN